MAAIYDQQAVRHAFAQELSQRYYRMVPAFKAFCDKVAGLPPEAVPVDHTALRFVDREAVNQVAILADALGMDDQGVNYSFPDKKLVARSFGVPGAQAATEFKIFVSTLDFPAFSEGTRALMEQDEKFSPHRLSATTANLLEKLRKKGLKDDEKDTLLADVFESFFQRKTPIRLKTAEAISQESMAAGVGAICSGEPNHVTPYVNALPAPLNDIERLRAAIEKAGIPLADYPIQGAKGSPLRQFGTQAQSRSALALDEDGNAIDITVTNEYVEFAERGPDESGQLYGGFKAEQATHIYTSNVRK